jgi:DNA-binding MarR family transcriptional regulator
MKVGVILVKMNARALGADRSIQLAMGIHRAHRDLLVHAAEFGAQHRLEVIHLSILHALGLRGPQKMGDLARTVVIGAPDMTRRGRQLEARGLVSRQRSPESQREVLMALTAAGQALFDRSFRHLHAAHKKYFDARLTVAEQRALDKLLAKLS